MSDKKKKGMIAEFKEFVSRGSVLDMAVGVIIATAFGKITASLVNDVFMPIFGFLFGTVDFTHLNIVLRAATVVDGTEIPAITIGIGTLIATVIDFLLIAIAIFLFVKVVNGARAKSEALRKQEEAAAEAAAPPEPSGEEVLLMEIRDLLKEGRNEPGK